MGEAHPRKRQSTSEYTHNLEQINKQNQVYLTSLLQLRNDPEALLKKINIIYESKTLGESRDIDTGSECSSPASRQATYSYPHTQPNLQHQHTTYRQGRPIQSQIGTSGTGGQPILHPSQPSSPYTTIPPPPPPPPSQQQSQQQHHHHHIPNQNFQVPPQSQQNYTYYSTSMPSNQQPSQTFQHLPPTYMPPQYTGFPTTGIAIMPPTSMQQQQHQINSNGHTPPASVASGSNPLPITSHPFATTSATTANTANNISLPPPQSLSKLTTGAPAGGIVFPPPALPAPTLRKYNGGLDLTSKFYRGTDGVSGFFLGATTIYDESMIINHAERTRGKNNNHSNQNNNKENGDDDGNTRNSESPDNSSSFSKELFDPHLVNLQELTSPKVRNLVDVAIKYLDRQILCYILDEQRTKDILDDICEHANDRNYLGKIFLTFPTNQYISPELIYSLCCIGSIYLDEPNEAQEYYLLSQRIIFNSYTFNGSTYPRLLALILNAVYDLNRGELTSTWQLSGMAFRMGFDLGFNDFSKEGPNPNLKCMVYWGCFIIDNFAGLIFGRPRMLMYHPNYPMYKNELFSPKLPPVIDLLVMIEPMIAKIYQAMSFKDAEEFKTNFVLKYSQLREFNVKLMEWRKSLPEELFWDLENIRRKNIEMDDHSLKFAFYLIFLILNKPFLQLPIGADIQFFIEMVEEVEIILRRTKESETNHLKNIVTLYVMILLCKILYIHLVNNPRNRDKHLAQLEFFIEYVKGLFKPDVWLLTKVPLRLLEEKTKKFKEELSNEMNSVGSQLQNNELNEDESEPSRKQRRIKKESTPSSLSMTKEQLVSQQQQQQQPPQSQQPIDDQQQQLVDNNEYVAQQPEQNMLQNDVFIKMMHSLFNPNAAMSNNMEDHDQQLNSRPSYNGQHTVNGNGGIPDNSDFNTIFSFDLRDLEPYLNE
ncbi:uncharacterized protein J8A68_003703 [[Candida] subhashii]|uniref:Xylanolytic transcriptional activator regulatory domain-containing protein n=1 Tax=[Candida] subhashii TaxID=561895 RepID=A0A8J5UW79_9ASCO|nr:uncharacterized protein J8A68_003703 [[Candida] subhashii]KAG7662780.1 hypothetical protein J8A68_003703 [[Candida] subhashii]